MHSFLGRYGPWAVVTGASSGIGQTFASKLAALGFQLVLVARDRGRLSKYADQLEDKYGIETRSVALDLSDPQSPFRLAEQTRDLKVGLLVNNAGGFEPGPFLERSPKSLTDLLNLNGLAPMLLSRLFAEQMGAHREESGIIFVSSTAGFQPIPMLADYAASKSHGLILAQGLYEELRENGIDVLALCPGNTKTPAMEAQPEFNPKKLPGPFLETEQVVDAAIRSLGRRPAVTVGIFYKLMVFLNQKIFPRKVLLRETMKAMNKARGVTAPKR